MNDKNSMSVVSEITEAENLSSETSYFVFEVAVSFYDTHVIEIVYKLTHSTHT